MSSHTQMYITEGIPRYINNTMIWPYNEKFFSHFETLYERKKKKLLQNIFNDKNHNS